MPYVNMGKFVEGDWVVFGGGGGGGVEVVIASISEPSVACFKLNGDKKGIPMIRSSF